MEISVLDLARVLNNIYATGALDVAIKSNVLRFSVPYIIFPIEFPKIIR